MAPGELAQLVEHLLCTQGVSGSSPLFSMEGIQKICILETEPSSIPL
ncbi:hypothetical protein SSM1_030 [Synechococcus phage S-SM1]|uniref:Uncharacterized protein n=1 Tax=Synechococcus phage S-SM1 TaxID=444859 RepID=E3SI39_9CAUD|nr:hypothetical protein SSM1_030 [Synechococcus phage S-SM1]ADO97318.1 hypothetical protein SSM1_030 [Synechococcus phage S-SM1]